MTTAVGPRVHDLDRERWSVQQADPLRVAEYLHTHLVHGGQGAVLDTLGGAAHLCVRARCAARASVSTWRSAWDGTTGTTRPASLQGSGEVRLGAQRAPAGRNRLSGTAGCWWCSLMDAAPVGVPIPEHRLVSRACGPAAPPAPCPTIRPPAPYISWVLPPVGPHRSRPRALWLMGCRA